jgi:hypothetical protein
MQRSFVQQEAIPSSPHLALYSLPLPKLYDKTLGCIQYIYIGHVGVTPHAWVTCHLDRHHKARWGYLVGEVEEPQHFTIGQAPINSYQEWMYCFVHSNKKLVQTKCKSGPIRANNDISRPSLLAGSAVVSCGCCPARFFILWPSFVGTPSSAIFPVHSWHLLRGSGTYGVLKSATKTSD